jgi:hypothetical protein
MRNLDVSAVSPSIGLPVKSGTIIHLQNAYIEAIGESIKGLIGPGYSPSVLYILQGMVNSGSGANYIISSGSCFFNGVMYICDGANITLSGNVAVCNITTTFFSAPNADGVQFTDGNVRNIHQINKVTIAPALGGSGIANYVDAQRISTNIPQVNITNGTGIGVSGVYPNIAITNTLPATNKVLARRKVTIGDLNTTPTDTYTALLSGSTNGLSAYVHTFPTAMPTSNFYIHAQFGNQGHNDWGGFNDNFMCVLQIGARSTTQFYFAIGTTASGSPQAAEFDYIIYSLD